MNANIISTLHEKFSECACTVCEERGCKLEFNDVPSEKVILSIDCIATCFSIKGKRCDYIIAVMDDQSTLFLIPVEFKTSTVKPEHIKKQLEGGIRFIQKHYQGQFVCYPVLVSKSMPPSSYRKLQKVKIKHRGGTARIKHISCNKSLQWDKVIF